MKAWSVTAQGVGWDAIDIIKDVSGLWWREEFQRIFVDLGWRERRRLHLLIYLLQKTVLELLNRLLFNLGINSEKGGFSKDILEVRELFLEQSILGREARVLLADVLLDFLELTDAILKLILVVLLPKATTDRALSVLKTPKWNCLMDLICLLSGLLVLLRVFVVEEFTVLVYDCLIEIFAFFVS